MRDLHLLKLAVFYSLLTFTTLGFAATRPNIIIILGDDLGYADLSCFGNDRYQTPNLDKMAKEGLKFTDFHSNGCVCSPTRAALMTGRYQQRSGVDEVVYAAPERGMRENYGLKTTEVTFAKVLKQAGYNTAMFGKWHLGYDKKFNPSLHGFNEFRGYVSGNIDYQSHIDGADFQDWWHNLELKDEPGYSTHLINRHAVEFIEANKDRPFCLYVANEAPHYPYQGPTDPPVRGPNKQPPAKGQDIQRAYAQMVEEMDKGVGEILATLHRLKLEKNTFVFFFSDNGGTREGNNGPLHGFKGSMWEGGHRIPAIAWWPGKVKPGTVTDQTAIGMDLLPTMAELAGAKLPGNVKFDGISLASLILKGKPLPERTLYWGYLNRYAVRQGPWKLIVNEAAATAPKGKKKKPGSGEPAMALFNLSKDLKETSDLSEKDGAKAAELKKLLEAWKQDVGVK